MPTQAETASSAQFQGNAGPAQSERSVSGPEGRGEPPAGTSATLHPVGPRQSGLRGGRGAILRAARPIVIDTLGVIVFAALLAMHVNLVAAVVISASTAAGVLLWHLATRQEIGTLQWMSLALVVITGGATLLTNDPRFIMAKATVVYAVVGVVMLRRGWMHHYLPPGLLPSESRAGLDLLTGFGYAWAGLMFATAAANLIVATAFTPWWPAFIGTVPLASKITLFLVQFAAMRRLLRGRQEMLPVTVASASVQDF